MSTITRNRKTVRSVDDNTRVEYNWKEEMSKEEYESKKYSAIHPKVLEKYRKEAPQLLEDRLGTANEENEQNFWQKVEKFKSEVKREVISVYRIKNKGTEHFYYSEELRSKDDLGNPIDHFHMAGYYDDPQFTYTIGPEGSKIATAYNGFTKVYELEWPKDFTPEIEKNLQEATNYYVKSDNRTYGGISLDDFKNRTFEELVTIGKYGTLAPKIIEIEQERQRNSKINKLR